MLISVLRQLLSPTHDSSEIPKFCDDTEKSPRGRGSAGRRGHAGRSAVIRESIADSRGELLSNVVACRRLRGRIADVEGGIGRPLAIHRDRAAAAACRKLGAHAFCHAGRIYLGPTVGTACGPTLSQTIAHELAHVVQVHLGRRYGHCDDERRLEAEAVAFAADPSLPAQSLRHRADPAGIYGLFWLLPVAAAAYVALRPTAANAPAPGDPTHPRISSPQAAGEAFALFAVPGAAFAIGGRLGLGFLSSSALAGATTAPSLRAVQDLGAGTFSGADVYVFDAITGAVVGVVVAGGIQLVGRQATVGLDWLATHGMRRSDLMITRRLSASSRFSGLPDCRSALLRLSKCILSGRFHGPVDNRRFVGLGNDLQG